jgi:hypothetical protein
VEFNDYLSLLDSELHAITHAQGKSDSEALAEFATKFLEEANELPDMELGSLSTVVGPRRKRMRVDAIGYDEIDRTIYGLIADSSGQVGADTLTKTDVDALVGQLGWFFEVSVDASLRSTLPNYEAAAQFAWDLNDKWSSIWQIKLIIVTTKKLSDRLRSYQAAPIQGKNVEVQIWDCTRLHDIFESRSGREEIQIDFKDFGASSLAALEAPMQFDGATTFLCVMPGELLAKIFDKYTSRLLEGNVRGFLSVRGDVNKSIRATILGKPDHFLAFNNGITATASAVSRDNNGQILGITDLQIVNGGQTTASLYNFLKQEKGPLPHLARVSVAMKLIVVAPEIADELVPDIAKYSNSQNKVTEADFFSNSPFHRRIEEISKRLVAPAIGGSQISTRWYYERARGSYENDRARASSTPANQRKFDAIYPKSQKIDKTELAKLHSIFNGKPHFARRGSQKNFRLFKDEVAPKFETDAGKAQFEDFYFKKVVVTKILYDNLYKGVKASEWHSQGFLADIVTYAISKLIFDLSAQGLNLNWDLIWQKQAPSQSLVEALLSCAKTCLAELTSDSRKNNLVTEWAKAEDCWIAVQKAQTGVNAVSILEAHSSSVERENRGERIERGRVLSELETLQFLNSVPREYWITLLEHPTLRLSPSNRQTIDKILVGQALTLEKRKAKEVQEVIDRAFLEGIPKPA